jgi:predicted flap endonuclease-1-like 5' DNA nuclease
MSRMPRPSDPPPMRPTPSPGVAERQRLMQMQTQLDEARSTIARQRNELDELREKMAEGDRRLAELLENVRNDKRTVVVEERLSTLGEEVRRRLAEAEIDQRERGGAIERLQTRLNELEDGEAARLRMRIERLTAQVRETEERALTIDHSQQFLRERIARLEENDLKRQARLAEIEESIEELAQLQRELAELGHAESIGVRLDALEKLVLHTGDQEAKLRREVASLRDSVAPPPPTGDDLTRIKGVGPKFARSLADMGITTFAQVAAWTEADLTRVADQLGIKAQRIEKAGWVAAAAALIVKSA